jgi:hypothetical protein
MWIVVEKILDEAGHCRSGRGEKRKRKRKRKRDDS